jgi:predicted amidohydrolase
VRVGTCQTLEIFEDVPAALDVIEAFAAEAAADDLDLLLFSEGFLQGYLVTPEYLARNSLDLESPAFRQVLARLAPVQPTLVFGVLELRDGLFFNSAVVVTRGELIGVYRKTHLTDGESAFTPGHDYPVFDLNGVRFGINICYDAQFPEAAAAVVAQGAEVLLLPAQNMMRLENAQKWKDLHNKIRGERVRETGMWLVSADVTGRRDEARVGYGPTCVINPQGRIVAQVPLLTTGLITAEISPRKR